MKRGERKKEGGQIGRDLLKKIDVIISREIYFFRNFVCIFCSIWVDVFFEDLEFKV